VYADGLAVVNTTRKYYKKRRQKRSMERRGWQSTKKNSPGSSQQSIIPCSITRTAASCRSFFENLFDYFVEIVVVLMGTKVTG
jgi:hypothetical protein